MFYYILFKKMLFFVIYFGCFTALKEYFRN